MKHITTKNLDVDVNLDASYGPNPVRNYSEGKWFYWLDLSSWLCFFNCPGSFFMSICVVMPLHFLMDVCHVVHLFIYFLCLADLLQGLHDKIVDNRCLGSLPCATFHVVQNPAARCLEIEFHVTLSFLLKGKQRNGVCMIEFRTAPSLLLDILYQWKNIGVGIRAWGPSHLPAGGGQKLFRTWASRSVLFHCFLFSFLCFISSVVLVRTGGDFGLFSNLLHVPDVEVPADSYAGLFQILSKTFGEMSCPSPSSHCDGGATRRGTRQPGQTPSMQVAIQTRPKPDEAKSWLVVGLATADGINIAHWRSSDDTLRLSNIPTCHCITEGWSPMYKCWQSSNLRCSEHEMLGVSTRLLCRSEFLCFMSFVTMTFYSFSFLSIHLSIFCHVISYMLFSAKCWPFLIISICFRSFSSTLNSCLCLLIFHDVFQWHVRCVRVCSDVDLFLFLSFQLLFFVVFYCVHVVLHCLMCSWSVLCVLHVVRVVPHYEGYDLSKNVTGSWSGCDSFTSELQDQWTRASERFRPWALNLKPHSKA